MPILKGLLKENEENIFAEATKISSKKKIVFSSSIAITTSCKIVPLCKHCEWYSNTFFRINSKIGTPQDYFLKNALLIERMGVKRIVIPSGWQGEDLPSYFYQHLQELRLKLSGEIWCAFGSINKDSLKNLKKIGIDGYSCGIETTNLEVFQKVRPGDDYKKRIKTIEIAKELGMKVETAMVIGIGEGLEDIIRGIILMKKLDVDCAALWPFCPCPFTEMEKNDIPNSFFMSKLLSAMVIYLENKDIVGDTRPKNLKWCIRAGANVFGVSGIEDCHRINEMRKNYINWVLNKNKG